jgi:drug/metabolite transporter (DMT)-like permease
MKALSGPRLGALLVLCSGLFWGAHGSLIKFAVEDGLTGPQLALIEFIFGALAFGLVGRRHLRPLAPLRKDHWWALIGGGFLSAGVATFLFLAYALSPIPIGATLIFLNLPTVFLVNRWLHRAPAPTRQWIAMIVVLAGAALGANLVSVDFGHASLAGVLPGALAGICYGGMFLVANHVAPLTTPLARSFWFSLGGIAVMVLCAPLTGALDLSAAPLMVLKWGLILGVCGQLIPVYTMMRGIPLVGTRLATIFAAIELPTAILVATLVLDDPFTRLQAIGVAAILGGILLAQTTRKTG